MGWRGHMTEIPVGMVFRKMYCHQCGVRLKKEKTKNVYKKGESGYTRRLPGRRIAIGMSELEKTEYMYYCPNCHFVITYDDQCVIDKVQKKLKKKILTQEEMKN